MRGSPKRPTNRTRTAPRGPTAGARASATAREARQVDAVRDHRGAAAIDGAREGLRRTRDRDAGVDAREAGRGDRAQRALQRQLALGVRVERRHHRDARVAQRVASRPRDDRLVHVDEIEAARVEVVAGGAGRTGAARCARRTRSRAPARRLGRPSQPSGTAPLAGPQDARVVPCAAQRARELLRVPVHAAFVREIVRRDDADAHERTARTGSRSGRRAVVAPPPAMADGATLAGGAARLCYPTALWFAAAAASA